MAKIIPYEIIRKKRDANVPSAGVATVPDCGTKNEFVTSGMPAITGAAAAINASAAPARSTAFQRLRMLHPP